MAFTTDDLEELTWTVELAWRRGIDRDWSAKAGTLEWSCTQTADHAVDCVFAPAAFLASGKLDGYPTFGVASCGHEPADLIEGLHTATRILVAVVKTAPPTAQATIWLRPTLETRGREDFAARAGLELILHAHDICTGLGIEFRPPSDGCDRLRKHTRDWPMWTAQGWDVPELNGDAWNELLRASGRT